MQDLRQLKPCLMRLAPEIRLPKTVNCQLNICHTVNCQLNICQTVKMAKMAKMTYNGSSPCGSHSTWLARTIVGCIIKTLPITSVAFHNELSACSRYPDMAPSGQPYGKIKLELDSAQRIDDWLNIFRRGEMDGVPVSDPMQSMRAAVRTINYHCTQRRTRWLMVSESTS